MALLGFFKKKPQTKITFTTHEYTAEEIREQFKSESKKKAEVQLRNFQKDDAGLYPHEILLLSYYEKYAAGKEIARFWEREYGIDDIPALMRSLEKRGFAADGKLSETGEREIKKNEYVLYMHRHKFTDISMADMSILVNKNPDKPYRDLLWAEFNRLSLEYVKSGKIGAYRNIELTMYQFLVEEKRYRSAFDHIAIVMFYDLNRDKSPFIAPGIIKRLRDLERLIDYTDEEATFQLNKLFDKIYAPVRNYTNDEAIRIILAYCYGHDEIAENIFNHNAK